jgi:hypothetical protein
MILPFSTISNEFSKRMAKRKGKTINMVGLKLVRSSPQTAKRARVHARVRSFTQP